MKEPVELVDIYDYYYIPFWQTMWFKISMAVLAAALITAFCIWWFVLRRKKPLTADQWAKRELAQLAVHKCTTQQDFRQLYFRLTEIIKGYLTRRYGWVLADKTDHELIAWLTEQQFDPTILDLLTQLADGAMWVKFANTSALKSQAETDVKTVHAMIDQTKIQE
jgi:hypothetical protein